MAEILTFFVSTYEKHIANLKALLAEKVPIILRGLS